jgi:hypothetical protein
MASSPACTRRVSSGSDHKVSLSRQALPEEGQHIRAAISHMHQETGGGRRAHLLDHLHPHPCFSVCSVAALIALFVGRRRDTKKGLLRQATQHRLRLWDDRQHGLKQEAAPFPIADLPQARHRGMCRQVDLRRILHQKHHRFCLQAGAGVLPMRLHQRFKSHFDFMPTRMGCLLNE